MGADNLQTVREAVAAPNDRDVDRYLALCSPDIELITPLAAIEGASVGADGIRRFFAGVEAAAEDFRAEIDSLRELGDGRVLAFMHVHMQSRGGVSLTEPLVNVYAFSGAKLRRVRVFKDQDEALRALDLDCRGG